jgi:hypothetical protein
MEFSGSRGNRDSFLAVWIAPAFCQDNCLTIYRGKQDQQDRN